jgi:magnesium-transporting ATPase (P-type)
MYQQCILIKSLQIVETFDAVSVIATDKTGTLTQNKMTVTHLFWDTDNAYKVPESKEEPIKQVNISQKVRRLSVGALNMVRPVSVTPAPFLETLFNGNINESLTMPSFSNDNQRNNISNVANEVKIQAFRDLLLGASLCNNAQKQITQDVQLGQDISKMTSELRLVGDAVDVALYNLCVDRCHIDIDKVRSTNPRLKVLPFNSSNKFMISANQLETEDLSLVENEHMVLITLKGAPDIVIQRCSSYKTNDDLILPLTTEVKEKLFNRQETLGKKKNIELKC